jgi:hypothetical protein
MSLHKLSAGHGYDYLFRQAALDATHRGRTDLASYYSGIHSPVTTSPTSRPSTPGKPGDVSASR